MSTIEYPNRLQRKSQLARYTIRPRVFFAKSLSQWRSRLERFACGLSEGSERANISDDAPGYGMAVRRVNRMPRSLSQAVSRLRAYSQFARDAPETKIARAVSKKYNITQGNHWLPERRMRHEIDSRDVVSGSRS
jgi:hypothetical protein